MKHRIVGYKQYPKSTLYYLVADDSRQHCDVGKSTASVFVPLSRHTPSEEELGKEVNLILIRINGRWESKIKF